jgi:hypothetical protein
MATRRSGKRSAFAMCKILTLRIGAPFASFAVRAYAYFSVR